MMKALYTGLREGAVLYQPGQERFNVDTGEYVPNPDGLWEVGQAYYSNAKFLREIPDGSLLKILYDGLPCLPKGNYKVIFMLRDEEEINASCNRLDEHLEQTGVGANPARIGAFDVFRPYRQDDIDHVLGICEARSDIELIKLNYRDVVEHPYEAFSSLGMPIDAEKAASVVKPEYYRFKREEINVHGKSGLERPAA